MKVVFVSNYLNHHQLPFSLEMDKATGHNFVFVATKPILPERLSLGYEDMNTSYPWIIRTYESEESYNTAEKLIFDADVIIYGSAPENLIKRRMRAGKLIFRYSERPYKIKDKLYKRLFRIFKFYSKFNGYKNQYMLCASAYTALDYSKTFSFINKTYKWGYFPEVIKYPNINEIINSKKKNSLLWVARLIDWKHPEVAIEVAKRLREDGYSINLNLIGNGSLSEKLQARIDEENLSEHVHLLGSMPPNEVRRYMEESEIFLFTSDRNEGWGAVLGEAMNSGCAVVASHMIGAVPFLMKDKENGLIYRDGDSEDLYQKVKKLLSNENYRKEIGAKAYETMINEWNAKNAVEKFLNLAKELLTNNKKVFPYETGVCSKAEILKEKRGNENL